MNTSQAYRTHHMTATELNTQLRQGNCAFDDTAVSGDFLWDSVSGTSQSIKGNLTLCNMTFKGLFDLGDLKITGELAVGGSIFQQRAAVYRTTASGLYAQQAVFEKGLALLNSQIEIVHLLGAQLPDSDTGASSGLLIKHTSGKLLNLTGVAAGSTILQDCAFETVLNGRADLGRRTSITLGELMA